MPQNPFGTPDDRGITLEGLNPFGGISKDYVDTPYPAEPAAAAVPPVAASMPAFGPSSPLSFLPRPQSEPNAMGKMMPLFAAMIAGGKNPAAIGAGLVGFMQGKRLRERERLDAATLQRKEQQEAAEFYERAVQNLSAIEDPIAFERALDALGPFLDFHNIGRDAIQFNKPALRTKKLKELQAKIDSADKEQPHGVYTLRWTDENGVEHELTRAEAAKISGSLLTDPKTGLPLAPSKVPTPRQAPTAGSFEEFVEAPPERRGKILADRKEYQQVDDPPRDAGLADINRQIAEVRLEGLRNKLVGGNRPVLSSDANRISELHTSLDDVDVLETELGTTGTGSKIGAMLPNVVTEFTGWGSDAKQRQAVIDRVKQVIGKALEGGVLRKEDEYKYEKILPTIGDPPEVAKRKIQGLRAALEQRRQRLLEDLSDAGYDISRFTARTAKTPGSAGTSGSTTAPGALKVGKYTVRVKP